MVTAVAEPQVCMAGALKFKIIRAVVVIQIQ